MKKVITILAFLCFVTVTQAQNFQFLYGYGNGKPVNFITSEMYKVQEHGTFYYFTDFKMDLDGYFEAYTEVSKYWNLSKNGLSLTAQYNVGIYSDGTDAFRIDPVYLAGFQKAAMISGWILSMDVLYRYDQFTSQSGAQMTFIFIKEWNKWLLSGYCDLWNSGVYEENVSPLVYMFEPQLFYSITDRFSIGIEGRISNYTLLNPYKDYAMLGVKWNLE